MQTPRGRTEPADGPGDRETRRCQAVLVWASKNPGACNGPAWLSWSCGDPATQPAGQGGRVWETCGRNGGSVGDRPQRGRPATARQWPAGAERGAWVGVRRACVRRPQATLGVVDCGLTSGGFRSAESDVCSTAAIRRFSERIEHVKEKDIAHDRRRGRAGCGRRPRLLRPRRGRFGAGLGRRLAPRFVCRREARRYAGGSARGGDAFAAAGEWRGQRAARGGRGQDRLSDRRDAGTGRGGRHRAVRVPDPRGASGRQRPRLGEIAARVCRRVGRRAVRPAPPAERRSCSPRLGRRTRGCRLRPRTGSR
jgi:hypothetical protein